jgi:hypothetical protein
MTMPTNLCRADLFIALFFAVLSPALHAQDAGTAWPTPSTAPATGSASAPRIAIEVAPAPLYDDPVWHGATDPAIVFLPGKGADQKGEYWMYYTQRRATLTNSTGVDWVHGSAIGIAASPDGLHWKYTGVAQGSMTDDGAEKHLQNPVPDNVTWWAPTVFWGGGNGIAGGGKPGDTLHMFVTHVHGIFTSWRGDRTIDHFTSTDGANWTYVSTLPLASRATIDPTVLKINGTWYIWYKNEAAGSRTFVAQSKDLNTWEDLGDAHIGSGHEAPFVFQWKNAFWDVQDHGPYLDTWKSDTGIPGATWTANTHLLDKADGKRPFDNNTGHHAWLILQDFADSTKTTPGNEQLLIFYFCHRAKRTYIQLAEVTCDDNGNLQCDRNKYLATTPASGQPTPTH